MLEGTRNERAAIVGAAYMIGFVTAFIAFGVNQASIDLSDATSVVTSEVTQTASVVQAINPQVLLFESERGLVLKTGNGDAILLTAKVSNELEASNVGDGIYTKLAHYELSPDGNYVYFCEEPLVDSIGCNPFVYSLANDSVVPLKAEGTRIAFAKNAQSIAWDARGVLTVSGQPVDQQNY